jgi:hypothetical protein
LIAGQGEAGTENWVKIRADSLGRQVYPEFKTLLTFWAFRQKNILLSIIATLFLDQIALPIIAKIRSL